MGSIYDRRAIIEKAKSRDITLPGPCDYPILKGPSKFDYCTSHNERRGNGYKVEFLIFTERGEEKIEGYILASLQRGEKQENISDAADPQSWSFCCPSPYVVVTPGTGGWLRGTLIGVYSTSTRVGWIRVVSRDFSFLLDAAFGDQYALRQLREKGYTLPSDVDQSWMPCLP